MRELLQMEASEGLPSSVTPSNPLSAEPLEYQFSYTDLEAVPLPARGTSGAGLRPVGPRQ